MCDERIKIIEWLNSIEKSYDVTELKIGDLHYWPILRWTLAKKFIQYEKGSDFDFKKGNFRSKIKKLRNFFLGGIYFILLRLKLLKKYEVIFSAASSHYITYKSKRINRLFLPIMEILNSKKIKFLTADYLGVNKDNDSYFPLVMVYNFLDKIRSNSPQKIDSIIFTGIVKDFQNEFDTTLDIADFEIKINTVFKWAEIYDLLIKACKPNWIFSICYYNLQAYGLNLACHRRNISSVEIQHGPQGSLHPAYSGFKYLPAKGFSTLPKIFWCWDIPSTENLQKIFKNSELHHVFHGGHPWISYLKNQFADNLREVSNEKIILFSLQTLKPILPEIFLAALKNTPSGFVWWIRGHPRMKEQDIQYLKKTLDSYIKNGIVEMDVATEMALPEALTYSDIHITRSSGCFIEACLMGVPNIIIDEMGELYYQSLIDNQKNFVQTTNDIWPLIKRVTDISSGELAQMDLHQNLEKLLKGKF